MAKTLRDFLCGGPGLSGYAYRAEVYCVKCGTALVRLLFRRGELTDLADNGGMGTTESRPQPVFFGESDTSVCCAACDDHLYGPEPEPEPEDDDDDSDDEREEDDASDGAPDC